MRTFRKEALFRFIKIMDIGYVVIIYFMVGIALAKLTDLLFGAYDPEADQKKSTTRLCIEIVGIIWFNLIIFYIARNIIQWIPSPLHGIYGYDHYRLKELSDSTVFGASYIYFQTNLRSKFDDLNKRMTLTEGVVAENLSISF